MEIYAPKINHIKTFIDHMVAMESNEQKRKKSLITCHEFIMFEFTYLLHFTFSLYIYTHTLSRWVLNNFFWFFFSYIYFVVSRQLLCAAENRYAEKK